MTKQIPPLQFDFHWFWFRDFRRLRNEPSIVKALDKITSQYKLYAESMFNEEPEDLDALDAERLDLEYHVAEVMVNDLCWLRKTMGDSDFVDLSLAIARLIYPDMSWEILENEDYLIVTNQERSIVLDLARYDTFEAGSSLLLVNASGYVGSRAQMDQVQALHQTHIDQHAFALAHIEASLRASKEAGSDVREIKPDVRG